MCVIVRTGGIDPTAPRWDRDNVAIVVADGLGYYEALKQTRAMLTWLGAPQIGMGATCWCGEPVEITGCTVRMPEQHFGPRRMEVPNAS
jgi:hypothetical protein